MALPGKGADVTLGLRPQHLAVVKGATHKVDMSEALGGISFIHLTGPTGEKLIVESKDDPDVGPGDMVGLAFDGANVMAFDAKDGRRLR